MLYVLYVLDENNKTEYLRYWCDRLEYQAVRQAYPPCRMVPAEFAKLCIDVGYVKPESSLPKQGELCEILS